MYIRSRCNLAGSFFFLIGVFVSASSMAEENDPPTITVSGTAEVQVVPDHAVLTFSIDSRAKELAAGVADNDAKVKAVIQYLSESSIEDKFVRTELIRIRPIFESRAKQGYVARQQQTNVPQVAGAGSKPPSIQPIGYTAVRRISLTIKDLKTFEPIYRGLIERGVNEVDGLNFFTSELRKHRDEARMQAIRAAREKATAMANELGCTLKAVQSIAETGSYGRPMMQNSITMAASSGGGGVASGMIKIQSTVNVVFVLGDVQMK